MWQRGEEKVAIFHFTVKIVGRSKGKSIISASAYLNGDVMKNEETGKVSYYTSKKEVVYTSLMMCENAPSEWGNVPDEKIKRFQKSSRYQRARNKEAALEKFKLIFRKQRLWNEVLKVEKSANAQLGRSFEFSLPREWSRQEQIEHTTEFIQNQFVDRGMCADWAIHDKGDGNPHVHLLVTMRPFKQNHDWGSKEVKDWEFVKDTKGEVVIDPTHPHWWQDKKNPERQGIRIPVMNHEGKQKVDSRNRKQWKRIVVDATGWNQPKNCELWRSEWANLINHYLPKEKWIDHRSFKRQGRIEVPDIHEGAEARKIEEKYQEGISECPSWKIKENQTIKNQNTILEKLQNIFHNMEKSLNDWRERLNDIRRKYGGYSSAREYDSTNRRTTGDNGRLISRTAGKRNLDYPLPETESKVAAIKRRVADTIRNLARYRRNVESVGYAKWEDQGTGNRKSAMERINREFEQRERTITDTEQAIAESWKRLEKVREMDERIRRLKAKRTNAGVSGTIGGNAGRNRPEGQAYQETTNAAKRIAGIKRETEQREQDRECEGIKERLEENKRIAAEREKQGLQSQERSRGISR